MSLYGRAGNDTCVRSDAPQTPPDQILTTDQTAECTDLSPSRSSLETASSSNPPLNRSLTGHTDNKRALKPELAFIFRSSSNFFFFICICGFSPIQTAIVMGMSVK